MNAAREFFRLQRRLFDVLGQPQAGAPVGARYEAVCGGLKLLDALHLRRLIQERRPRDILEVGTFLGFSACWLATQAGPEARVVSVDPDIPHRRFGSPVSVARRLIAGCAGSIELVKAYFGAAPDTAAPSLGASWDRRFDLVFIDGDHSYESVLANFELALSLLRPGGCVAFHDALSWPRVWWALQTIRRRNRQRGSLSILGGLPIPFLQDGVGVFRLGLGEQAQQRGGRDESRRQPV